ncbi:hypothetical protein [Limosilactobacillus fermentum]|uniref:hypothetical protein n=1 Tax=Limosilactobacillus fermentum TaxID=1613 RepID=UPI0018827EA5|nr:hypothetical protein [Limosilactobacillus fermentum]MBE8117685.1 hypothetical protein [Limosilactobacillus fermentum]
MATENITTSKDLIAQSIDFTEQFTGSISTLLQVLNVTRMQPMAVGSQIKIYKSEVTKADGNVAEGEVIPLSKVTRKLADTKELAYKKYRKQTTAEAIQSSGFAAAVNDTDSKLLRSIQGDIKKDFFDFVQTGTTKANGETFQKAIAQALGQLAIKWEDDDVQSVLFANPLDFYTYLGDSTLTTQTAFGLTYIQNYLGFDTIILTGAVKQGTIAATASQNLNYAYASMNGSLSQAFSLTTDETGLIGVVHNALTENASYETLALTSGVLFPERLDGIVVATVGTPASK